MTANETYVAAMVFIVLFCSVFEMSISLVYFLYNLITVIPRYCCKSKRMTAAPTTPALMGKNGAGVQDQYQQLTDSNKAGGAKGRVRYKSEQLPTHTEEEEI
jgi:hypothetical protein